MKKLMTPIIWMTLALTASALNIDLSYHGSVPADKLANVQSGMNRAVQAWEDLLIDEVTIKIEVKWVDSFPNPAEGARATVYYIPTDYKNVRDALSERVDSAEDQQSFASLSTTDDFPLFINHTSNSPNGDNSPTPYLDNDGDQNNTKMRVSLGNAKALGLLPGDFDFDDGKITVSGSPSWDFDPTDGITPGQADFVAICLHEIGHVLGMNSLIDGRLAAATGNTDDHYAYVTPIDLFRYSAESAAQGAIDWAVDSREKFFSIDSGNTSISGFSTGIKGDGYDPSHWARDGQLDGIFEPSVYPLQQIERADLTAMDVIGWTVRPLEQILKITSARVTDKGMRLEWEPVEGYTGYRILISDGITETFREARGGEKGLNFWESEDGRFEIQFFYVEAYR